MEVFPQLQLGWMNGWILLIIWFFIQGLCLLLVPQDVRSRLFELNRSRWQRKYKIPFGIGKLTALIFLVVAALTPIQITSYEFVVGSLLFIIGLIGLSHSIWDFKNTPLDRPVAVGTYRYSRHPQLVALLAIGSGLGIALSSWTLVLFRIVSFGFEHAGVLAEEEECIQRFGLSYEEYMKRVPRYVLV